MTKNKTCQHKSTDWLETSLKKHEHCLDCGKVVKSIKKGEYTKFAQVIG